MRIVVPVKFGDQEMVATNPGSQGRLLTSGATLFDQCSGVVCHTLAVLRQQNMRSICHMCGVRWQGHTLMTRALYLAGPMAPGCAALARATVCALRASISWPSAAAHAPHVTESFRKLDACTSGHRTVSWLLQGSCGERAGEQSARCTAGFGPGTQLFARKRMGKHL